MLMNLQTCLPVGMGEETMLYKLNKSEKQTQADVHSKLYSRQHSLNPSRLTLPRFCCIKLIGYVTLIDHGQLLHKQKIWAAKENKCCKFFLCKWLECNTVFIILCVSVFQK